MGTPGTYREWLEMFRLLAAGQISGDAVLWERSRCEGIDAVLASFMKRLTDTVNEMADRAAKSGDRALNEALSDGDFSQTELLLRRCDRAWERTRFFRLLSFLPQELREELDRQVQGERRRYWKQMERYLEEAVQETGQEELLDLHILTRRLGRQAENA